MKNKLYLLALLLANALILTGCDSTEKAGSEQAENAQTAAVTAPAFNADSAYTFIEKQVAFGPRIPNTPEHQKTGDWIISNLKAYGADVKVQSFEMRAYDGTLLKLRNITATFNPEAGKRVLLAAHWDTRPWSDRDDKEPLKTFDGANDSGSGVGVLLEIARTLHAAEQKPDVGVDMVFFDGEDYGQPDNSGPQKQDTWCLGSQYWSKNPHVAGYKAHYGILLDMVGAENAKFAKEGTSMQFAPNIVEKVWKAGNSIGYSDYFKYVNAPAIIDDHTYVNNWANIPMIDIIEYNMGAADGDYFGHYHHRQTDNMSIISRTTLKAVGQTVLHVLYNE